MPIADSLNVVVLFHDADGDVLRRLEAHLRQPMRRQGDVLWHRDMAQPGCDLEHEISHHLETARLVLVLLSADFIASCCNEGPIADLLERKTRNVGTDFPSMIPIIARPCLLKGLPLARIRPIPTDGLPVVVQHGQLDEARIHIAASEVLDAIERYRQSYENVTALPRDKRLYEMLIEAERDRHRLECALALARGTRGCP